MIFHINTLLPALEVNGMALLQEKPMVEVAFVVVYTFPAMFSAVLCTVRRAAIYNPWTRPLHPLHTLQHSKSAYTGSLHIHCVLYYLWSAQCSREYAYPINNT